MAKKETQEIGTLADYVKINCTDQAVSLEQVEEYAAKGQQFLKAVMSVPPGTFPSDNKSDNVAYLHWYLIKESFDQKKPFSKGMFNLEGEDDEATKRLYNYLKGENIKEAANTNFEVTTQFAKGMARDPTKNNDQAYSRASTHYRNYLADAKEGHFGIDKVTIPLAWRFKTHGFGLCSSPDGKLSIYLKPETASADLNKTQEAVEHGVNLIKSMIVKEKIEGMPESFRENALSGDIKKYVVAQLQNEGIRDAALVKKIIKCKTIPDLRVLIKERDLKVDLDKFLVVQYGSTNQIGSEQRFKITNDGQLRKPMDPSTSSDVTVSPISDKLFYTQIKLDAKIDARMNKIKKIDETMRKNIEALLVPNKQWLKKKSADIERQQAIQVAALHALKYCKTPADLVHVSKALEKPEVTKESLLVAEKEIRQTHAIKLFGVGMKDITGACSKLVNELRQELRQVFSKKDLEELISLNRDNLKDVQEVLNTTNTSSQDQEVMRELIQRMDEADAAALEALNAGSSRARKNSNVSTESIDSTDFSYSSKSEQSNDSTLVKGVANGLVARVTASLTASLTKLVADNVQSFNSFKTRFSTVAKEANPVPPSNNKLPSGKKELADELDNYGKVEDKPNKPDSSGSDSAPTETKEGSFRKT